MSAVPQQRPANSQPDPIIAFRQRYAQALLNAQISAELTQQPGWQQLYSGHKAVLRAERKAVSDSLKSIALEVEDFGTSEDREKAIGEAKKSCVAMGDRETAFELQTIGPVREPVMECDRIRAEALNEARRIESEAPMHHIGLEELMREEVGRVDRPTWDGESGLVKIVTPGN